MMSPLLFLLVAWQEPGELDQVLGRVQGNIAEFQASLPDFVCNERITSSRLAGNRVTARVVNESVFASSASKDPLSEQKSREVREMISIDGQKVEKETEPRGPFILIGGFSGAAAAIFDKRVAEYRNYRLEPESRGLLVIAFETKKGQTGIGAYTGGRKFLAKDSGKAWIDPKTMQVVRLETLVVNGPTKLPYWLTQVDFAAVHIEGRPFWLPVTVRSSLRKKPNLAPERTFLAEYENYRKFDVSTGIVFH